MDKMYDMKLNESLTPNIKDNTVLILRVPGGWIYRFWEGDREWRINSVFVPLNSEFNK